MTRRAARLLLVASLLYGSGAHWLALQGAAWGGMIAARVRTSSLAEAVATTFGGETPCRVCLLVDRGVRAPDGPALTRPAPTVELAAVTAPALAASVPVRALASAPPAAPRPADRTPLLPPPKPSAA